VGRLAIDRRQLSSSTFLHPNTYGHDCLVLTLAVGVKGDRRYSAFARWAHAIGERIDEGAIQEIMRKMFCQPETKSMDTTEKKIIV
jgi:hypothetical protein